MVVQPGDALTPVDTELRAVEVYDLTFAGYDGHPVRGWLRLPRARDGRLPAVVQFHGYGSGRGHPYDDLPWACAGYAHLFSTGLADDICPPSTVFGAYHAYRGPKRITTWEFNGHEAGGSKDLADALAVFRGALAPGNEER
ncbi:acetylxylan esterase [Streptomyces sp. NPDC056835]|uniref:acetylxylan esterase n=1 Tax=Streptomyces sp. NPDC056835 TaxID=3345956 RepID=UPI0036C95746